MKSITLGTLILGLAGLMAAPADLLKIATETQLFADDYVIDSTTNLIRRVNPLTKHSREPILRADQPWEDKYALLMTALYDEDEHLYKIWYRPGADKFSLAYATSTDGVKWDKLALHMVKWHGSDNNNLLPLAVGMGYNGIFKDSREKDPSRRYKLLGYGWNGGKRSGPIGICICFSPDGLHWTENPSNPVLLGIGDTHSPLGWDERISKYVAYLRPDNASPVPGASKSTPGFWTQGIRIVGRSTSEDMLTWTPIETVLKPDDDDPPGTQFYLMTVFQNRGLYFGLISVYHPNQLMIDVQLALSRDGIHWDRAGRRHPILSYGLPDQFDSHILIAMKPILIGDRYRVYYLAEDNHHGFVSLRETFPIVDFEPAAGAQPWRDNRRGAIGLAEISRDRMLSLDADDRVGVLVTKPFVVEGRQLRLDANATGGEVRVEVADRNGNAIAGLGVAEAVPISGDSTGHTVSWKKGAGLAGLKGQTVQLRITAHHARLYSFQVQP